MATRSLSQVVKLRRQLDEILRTRSFRGKSNVWNRTRNSIIDVVELQPSRWNTPDRQDFTINLGVLLPEIYEVVYGKAVPDLVKESSCIVRARLGSLMDGGRWAAEGRRGELRDRWWTIEPSTDVDALARQVGSAVLDPGLVFLEQFDSLRTVHKFYLQFGGGGYSVPYEQVYLAVMKGLLGEREEADRLLAAASETLGLAEWLAEVRERMAAARSRYQ